MISWGAICMALAGTKNRETLIALRLLLGGFEAGFVPCVFYYLGTLYPHYMLGFRLGLFAGMFSIAGAFSNLFAYGIFQIKSPLYKDWQLLFLIEGGATILMSVITFFVLPAKISSAWFLTPEQRIHAERRMQIDNPHVDKDGNQIEDDNKVTRQNVKDAFSDWRTLLIICCNIASVLPVSVFSVFMPLIVKGMGYKALKANLMSVSPFVV
jgi:MFS family permease